MIELHSYITTGNSYPVKDAEPISIELMYNEYVLPIAQFDFELVPHFVEFTPWDKLLQDRARLVHETISKSDKPVAWVDTDVLFIRECSDRLLELLGDNDLVAMDDGEGNISCGLVVYASNDNVIELTDKIAKDQASYDRGIQCDQEAINKYRNMVKWKLLPKDEFFSVAYWIGSAPIIGWRPTNEIIPDNVRVIHATSVFANEKIPVLESIRAMLKGR